MSFLNKNEMKYPSLLSSAELGKLMSLKALGGMAYFGTVLPTRMLQLPEFVYTQKRFVWR